MHLRARLMSHSTARRTSSAGKREPCQLLFAQAAQSVPTGQQGCIGIGDRVHQSTDHRAYPVLLVERHPSWRPRGMVRLSGLAAAPVLFHGITVTGQIVLKLFELGLFTLGKELGPHADPVDLPLHLQYGCCGRLLSISGFNDGLIDEPRTRIDRMRRSIIQRH